MGGGAGVSQGAEYLDGLGNGGHGGLRVAALASPVGEIGQGFQILQTGSKQHFGEHLMFLSSGAGGHQLAFKQHAARVEHVTQHAAPSLPIR